MEDWFVMSHSHSRKKLVVYVGNLHDDIVSVIITKNYGVSLNNSNGGDILWV